MSNHTYRVIEIVGTSPNAEWHRESDLIIAEMAPGVTKLLSARIPYTEFVRKWKEGWRPRPIHGFGLSRHVAVRRLPRASAFRTAVAPNRECCQWL